MPYYQTPLHEIPDPSDNLHELLSLMDRGRPVSLHVLDDPQEMKASCQGDEEGQRLSGLPVWQG